MARFRAAALAAGVLGGALCAPDVAAQTPGESRAIVFHFTPTARAQIAIWVEAPDGTFLKTVGLTQAVSVRGIGNRPGATQMNSGYHWPYGRREGVLPIWAHRRAAAPDVPGQFPRIIFQKRDSEGDASRAGCEDSTPDSYFCLPFSGNTRKDGLDAISCASQFNSDKGRFLGQADVDAGYAEPVELGGQDTKRALPLVSLYPPRRDVTPCAPDPNPVCQDSVLRACKDFPDVGGYVDAMTGPTPERGLSFADAARAAMPDIDAVTMATPPADQEQAIMFSVPDGWAPGGYVAWLEINTEGDYNSTFSDLTYPTPSSSGWDSWAMTTGYPYRGQPSVIFSVPFTLGSSATTPTAEPVGYGSVDGLESDAATMHSMDGSITDDPVNGPGSGADRLRMPPGSTHRLQVEVRDYDFCQSHAAPAIPTDVTAAPVVDPKHAHQWGHLHFVAPASSLPIARYDVRFSMTPIVVDDPTSFIQGLPALAATSESQALAVPTTGAPGGDVDVDFGGMTPSTHYWVGVRAVDVCNRSGANAVGELTTTRVDFTKLSGCFVATAAWGSALAPEVSALRRVRDRLRPESALFAVATDLYYRSGPAVADLLARSGTARALARRLIGPLGAAALVQGPR